MRFPVRRPGRTCVALGGDQEKHAPAAQLSCTVQPEGVETLGFFRTILEAVSGRSTGVLPASHPPVCPQCRTPLASAADTAVAFFPCSTCRGIWLSAEAFAELLRRAEEQVADVGQGSSEHTLARSDTSRLCPCCERRMDNYQFEYQSGIWIDACPDGHGVWLDGGELELIRGYRLRSREPMTAEEKAGASMAMLDGAIEGRRAALRARLRTSAPFDGCGGE